ncbi:MAG: START domain-containing protein [Myxococcota bacterium]|nr:START domain-containing protein [Myxococcota bacterium]
MKTKLGVIVVLFTAAISAHAHADEGWKLEKDKKGVKVHSRAIPGSEYREFRAAGTKAVPLEVGVEVMKDYNHYVEWFGMCNELRVIKKRSENDYDMYFILDMPFPLTNRDVVVNVKTGWDFEKRTAWVKIKGIKSNYKKDSGLVRITKYDGEFEVVELEPGKTRVSYTLHAEIAGSLSPKAYNLAAYKHPYKTGTGLREQLDKEKYWKRASQVHNKQFRYAQK